MREPSDERVISGEEDTMIDARLFFVAMIKQTIRIQIWQYIPMYPAIIPLYALLSPNPALGTYISIHLTVIEPRYEIKQVVELSICLGIGELSIISTIYQVFN